MAFLQITVKESAHIENYIYSRFFQVTSQLSDFLWAKVKKEVKTEQISEFCPQFAHQTKKSA